MQTTRRNIFLIPSCSLGTIPPKNTPPGGLGLFRPPPAPNTTHCGTPSSYPSSPQQHCPAPPVGEPSILQAAVQVSTAGVWNALTPLAGERSPTTLRDNLHSSSAAPTTIPIISSHTTLWPDCQTVWQICRTQNAGFWVTACQAVRGVQHTLSCASIWVMTQREVLKTRPCKRARSLL